MYLTQRGNGTIETKTHIEFEKVADDLLMISLDNDTDNHAQIFSYWRLLGKGGNPPLEIGVNTETDTIKSITFFVDLDCLDEFQFSYKNTILGNILVDSSIFNKPNDYVNNQGSYFVALAGNKFMCRFNEKCNIKETVVNKNIEFYMDTHNQLRGFAINNLTELEIKTITSLL